MLTFADVAVHAAEWLATASPEEQLAPASPPGEDKPRRLVIRVERDGSLLLISRGASKLGDPPPDLPAACSAWELSESEGRMSLRVVADPVRVSGRLDEPATLFALHALAARRPDIRVILELPPEHVGKRW